MLTEKLFGTTNLPSTNKSEFLFHKTIGELVLNLMRPIDTTSVLTGRDPKRHLGLYVHIPFCTEICSFCAFHREVPRTNRQGTFVNALETHIDSILNQLDGWQNVQSIYFGGGTPGLLRPDEVERLLSPIRKNVALIDTTATFELHPENVSAQYLKDLISIGITRFSVGVQNLSVAERISLGRGLTSPAEDIDRLRIMKGMGVAFNVDLMFGTPEQTKGSWRMTLEELVSKVEPSEITLYQYVNAYGSQTRKKIEQGTMARPGVALRYKLYNDAKAMLSDEGYHQTSALSFCKSTGKDYKRRLLNRGRDFVGLGPRTYSKVGGHFFINDATTSDFVSGAESSKFYGLVVPDWFFRTSETVLSSVGEASTGQNNLNPWKSEAIAQIYGVLYYVLNQPRIRRRLGSN